MAKIILDHRGRINYSTIDTLLSEFKSVFRAHEIQFHIYKRIITVMIEALENIYKYNDFFEDFVESREEYMPSFELTRTTDMIRIKTSNPVRVQDMEAIRRSIEKVNQQESDSLSDMYVEVISNGEFSSNGGAGLGFIEMARTSRNKLEYDFEEVTEHYAIYTFIVTFAC